MKISNPLQVLIPHIFFNRLIFHRQFKLWKMNENSPRTVIFGILVYEGTVIYLLKLFFCTFKTLRSHVGFQLFLLLKCEIMMMIMARKLNWMTKLPIGSNFRCIFSLITFLISSLMKNFLFIFNQLTSALGLSLSIL